MTPKPKPPLCVTIAIGPGFSVFSCAVPPKPMRALSFRFRMPRQLGPTMRTLALRAAATSFSCSDLPASPTSLNPPESTSANGMPALPHCSIAPSTCEADSAMSATSHGCGTAMRSG